MKNLHASSSNAIGSSSKNFRQVGSTKDDDKIPSRRKQNPAVKHSKRRPNNSNNKTKSEASKVPAKPLSAYNLFFRDERSKWLAEREKVQQAGNGHWRANLFCDMGREIGRRWKALSPEQIAVYQKMAEEDKKRFKQERREYIERETREAWQQYEIKQGNDRTERLTLSRTRQTNDETHGVDGSLYEKSLSSTSNESNTSPRPTSPEQACKLQVLGDLATSILEQESSQAYLLSSQKLPQPESYQRPLYTPWNYYMVCNNYSTYQNEALQSHLTASYTSLNEGAAYQALPVIKYHDQPNQLLSTARNQDGSNVNLSLCPVQYPLLSKLSGPEINQLMRKLQAEKVHHIGVSRVSRAA